MENLQLIKGKTFKNSQPQITISTDASLKSCRGGGEEGGAYGQGQKTGGALTSREKKDYINVLKLRAVKYTILTFFSFACQRSINMHSNGQYRCHFIFGENGRYSKQISDCLEQKNIGLFVDPRVHKRISPRVTQSGGRYSVQDSK